MILIEGERPAERYLARGRRREGARERGSKGSVRDRGQEAVEGGRGGGARERGSEGARECV